MMFVKVYREKSVDLFVLSLASIPIAESSKKEGTERLRQVAT